MELETLKTAREQINSIDRWTQFSPARAFNNMVVPADSPLAVKWCSTGACFKVSKSPAQAMKAVVALGNTLGLQPISISYFNDTHTHAEVLAAFDAAIAKLEPSHAR